MREMWRKVQLERCGGGHEQPQGVMLTTTFHIVCDTDTQSAMRVEQMQLALQAMNTNGHLRPGWCVMETPHKQ